MKGEYGDDATTSPALFSKFHHHHHPPPPPPSGHFPASNHHFNLATTSEEADSRKPTATTTKKEPTAAANDGASIEVNRRPRGRPPGSKNKPKPPIIITREPDPCMSPYVLELCGGSDIVDAVTHYSRRRNMGLCVLTATGTVANVSLRQPTTAPAATVTFHGRFDILSISATVLPSSASTPAFTISLAGPQGQIVGGAVAGPLISAGTVYIIAASFNNPVYQRLPVEDDDDNHHLKISGGGSGAGSEQQSPPGASDAPPSTAADTMSLYSCHLPSDVIWAPTPRQAAAPPQPPY